MNLLFLTEAAVPETVVEEVQEVVQEVTNVYQTTVECQCDTESVVTALEVVASKLDTVSEQLNSLYGLGIELLEYLESGIPEVIALLLILVGFEVLRLVKGWYGSIGGKKNGRSN